MNQLAPNMNQSEHFSPPNCSKYEYLLYTYTGGVFMIIFSKIIKFTFIFLSTFSSFTSMSTHVFAQSKPESSVVYLDQGWDDIRRDQFYYTPQVSRLFPYSWFLALEQTSS